MRNLSLRHNRINATGAVAVALMIRDYPDIVPGLTPSNSNPSTPQTSLEASISQLSLHSSNNEDWNRTMVDERPEPSTTVNGHQTDVEATPENKFGTRGRKFGEMLRKHMENGRSLNLSDEEEENLSDELGKWVS